MVKHFLLVVCIFLVCLSFVRFALGAPTEIDTFKLTYYLANYGGTTESVQEAFATFTKFYEASVGFTDDFKLAEYAEELRALDDGSFKDKANEFFAFLVDFLNGTLGIICAFGSLLAMLLLHGFPLCVGLLKDLVFVLQIISTLIFGVGAPT